MSHVNSCSNSRKKNALIKRKTPKVQRDPSAFDIGDLKIKFREFLEQGYKVVLQLQFRGREMAHRDLGFEMIKRFAAMLEDVSKIEQMPRQEGRRMNAVLASTVPPNKRVVKGADKDKGDDKGKKNKKDKAEAPAEQPATDAAPAPEAETENAE